MAIIRNNRVYGVVGDVVYYTDRSGNQRTRKRPVIKVSPTDKQMGTRLKFRLGVHFLNPIRALINTSWHVDLSRGVLPYDNALGRLIRQSIEGEYPDLKINYQVVQISDGKMDGPLRLSFNMEGDEAVLAWEILPWFCRASSPDDILQIMLVNEAKKSMMVFEKKALRGDLSLRIALPETFGNDELHGFFFFVNHNGKDASATSYRKFAKMNDQG